MNSPELEKYVCGIFHQKDLFDTLKKLALFDLSSDTPWLGTPVTFIYIYKSIGVVIYTDHFVHFIYSLSKLNSAQLRRQASCQCQSRLCSGNEGSHTMLCCNDVPGRAGGCVLGMSAGYENKALVIKHIYGMERYCKSKVSR